MLVQTLLLVPLLCGTTPERVELVFGGDVIPHGEVKEAAADHARSVQEGGGTVRSLNNEGWDHVFGPITDVLRTADVAMVNLETPVSGDPRAPTAPLIFDAPPAMLRALASAGVDVVSVANNHAFDQRRAGVAATWKHLSEAGLRSVGSGSSEASAWQPLILEKRGMRIGFLSFTRWLNGAHNPSEPDTSPHVAYVPYNAKASGTWLAPEAAVELVRAAARRCDALIVAIHWGTEYSHSPHPDDRKLARALLEAGALAIIGHHPHVLQPIESYRTTSGRDTLVAFSLGNLIANQDRYYVHGRRSEEGGNKRDSLLLRLSLTRPAPGAPVSLAGTSVLPVWIENNHYVALGRGKVARHIQPVLLDEELQVINERLVALAARAVTQPREVRQERTALERRLDMARRRRELILQIALPPGADADAAKSGRRPAGAG
ncbi:CapA family protein [Archangium violaceum]|uniref:CapA family protein n=1 Tax=Archangium violaceum TaxID=83451 RepID=UPI00194EA21D|nr:CapA family protein [Archangium violaceum]QRN96491.1 CapA family protein [Archangium violaceum]